MPITLPKSGTSYTVSVSSSQYTGSATFSTKAYIPNTPQISGATATSTTITFGFTQVPNATGYQVYLNGTAYGSVLAATATTATITGLSPATSYTVGIQAIAPDAVSS